MLPLVVMLDLDGTIIGDITPQIASYEIYNKIKFSGGSLNYKFKDFHGKLLGGIIRPYFCEFIKKLQANVSNIEFFVYTAGTKEWASYVIKHIEKACKIKFNRPMFTRSNCILVDKEYRKSIKHVKPMIMRSLKKKYPIVTAADLNDRIMVVDNMDVYNNNESKYHIHCKTYDYKYPENIPAMFDHQEYKKYWQLINTIIDKYHSIKVTEDFLEFQQVFYSKYAQTISALKKSNDSNLKDTFYKNLYKVMVYMINDKKYEKFDAAAIRYINKQLGMTGNIENHSFKRNNHT